MPKELEEGIYKIWSTVDGPAKLLLAKPNTGWAYLWPTTGQADQHWTVLRVPGSKKPQFSIKNSHWNVNLVVDNAGRAWYLRCSAAPQSAEGWLVEHVPNTTSSYRVIWHTGDRSDLKAWKYDRVWTKFHVILGTDDGFDDRSWHFERIGDAPGQAPRRPVNDDTSEKKEKEHKKGNPTQDSKKGGKGDATKTDPSPGANSDQKRTAACKLLREASAQNSLPAEVVFKTFKNASNGSLLQFVSGLDDDSVAACVEDKPMEWKLKPQSQKWKITNPKTDTTLMYIMPALEHAQVYVHESRSSDRLWDIIKTTDDSYFLSVPGTGLVASCSIDDIYIRLEYANGSLLQKWKFA